MAHTYASVDDFKAYRSGGEQGTAADELIRRTLEGASRTVDGFCRRSRFGSGFGPRLGTNYYDGQGESKVVLHDDLIALSSVVLLDSTNGSPLGPVAESTDYYLWPYEPPFREVQLHDKATVTAVGIGRRVTALTGTWGYESRTRPATETLAADIDDAIQTLTLSAATDVKAGHTILIDAEQIYVRTLAGTTASVERGANGTTAAAHSTGASIAIYQYEPAVVDATIRIAHRRFRGRDAGVTPGYGGAPGIPVVANQDSEWGILWATVGEFRLPGLA